MNNIILTKYSQYLKNEISFDEARTSISQVFAEKYIKDEFEKLFLNHDFTFIEVLFKLASWFEVGEVFLPYYNRLLVESWHFSHEWVIEKIQSYKSPSSIDFIAKALNSMNFNYLEQHDTDYPSFIRKCMWVLAEINTEESIALLKSYLENENPVIKQYADEQLRWLNGEKGMRYMG